MKSKFLNNFLSLCHISDERQAEGADQNCYPIWERDSDSATINEQKVACAIFANAVAARAAILQEGAMGYLESPIERLFFMAFLIEAINQYNDVSVRSGDGNVNWNVSFSSQSRVTIQPQAIIGQYRVDFLLEYEEEVQVPVEGKPAKEWPKKWSSQRMIVECDGHDFHEKTKEQAKRDKRRDRDLMRCGYRVYHFTGSEIWNEPFRCARESYDELATYSRDQK